jgi:hypothetical protein
MKVLPPRFFRKAPPPSSFGRLVFDLPDGHIDPAHHSRRARVGAQSVEEAPDLFCFLLVPCKFPDPKPLTINRNGKNRPQTIKISALNATESLVQLPLMALYGPFRHLLKAGSRFKTSQPSPHQPILASLVQRIILRS